jgi:N-methylhydantoinase B
VPIEILESGYPLVVHERQITPDSGGPGRYRGGCGQTMRVEIKSPLGGSISSSTDRISIPASGASGGGDGMVGAFFTERGPLEAKGSNRVNPGEVITFRLPGGAGFGPALERSAEEVQRDVIAGYVSPEEARNSYKVVIDSGDLSIDEAGTRELRTDGNRGST